ncbi:MAG: radical SAM protein [Clostridiales bacterium]|nr:radical SAM protein [Clostridiales bacterium]
MDKCNNCARNCKIDRKKTYGYCKANNLCKIAKVMTHYWEEPIISGHSGSGAIFFSNCNLRCVYCQNYQISHNGIGIEISANELAKIFQDLENSGVHNINLVTPTHYVDQIIEALKIYKPSIPIVWNTNGYESTGTIEKIRDYIDIYLFDLKYYDSNISKKYSDASDYFETASKNILFARNIIPTDIITNGLMQKGIIVRHLVLPNNTNDSINILKWIKEYIPNTIISLMSQYVPYYKANNYTEINRKLNKLEYKRVLSMCQDLNLNGFMQDMDSADEIYIPNFNED